MAQFKEVLEESELHDVGWHGDKFTWSNRHVDETFTKEILDRAVTNSKWFEAYPDKMLEVLPVRCSDHRSIVLWFDKQVGRGKNITYKRKFRYEAAWALEEDCGSVIGAECGKEMAGHSHTSLVQRLLANCSKALTNWDCRKEKDRGK
ncbi:hypothetical protein F2P56_016602 [Juglans regia]|uniref:Reverse transcriptase n=1 Tax=Juglans regia TaxID=51240 RepID=A0A833XGW0_JUGRE|nr:hypothetical protein F2P56_016602 [Juglans regia]